MTSQNIWATFCNMKFKEYMLDLLVNKYQRLDRRVNVVLEIASSGSIATWAIWQKVPELWGGIIALSQVITAIKPHFPYFKIVKELNSRCLQMNHLNNDYELFYAKVKRGKLNDETTEQSYFDFNKLYAKVLNFPDDIVFDCPDEIEQKAQARMNTFLISHYNVDIFKPKGATHGKEIRAFNASDRERTVQE